MIVFYTLDSMSWSEVQDLSNNKDIRTFLRKKRNQKVVDPYIEAKIRNFISDSRKKCDDLKKRVKAKLEKFKINKYHADYARWVYFALVTDPTTQLSKCWDRVRKSDEEGFRTFNPYFE